jgi:hypothetical protein
MFWKYSSTALSTTSHSHAQISLASGIPVKENEGEKTGWFLALSRLPAKVNRPEPGRR